MVGKKGEIYTSAELEKRANIKAGGKVTANVIGRKLVIEAIPFMEEMLRRSLRCTTRSIVKVSEVQKEEGING